jgi:protein phosphatase
VRLEIPELSLVVLVGAAGSGKSTFAARQFRPSEVLESDAFRAMVADDPADQLASPDAFEVLHLVAAKRLARRRLTVVDATNLQAHARRPLRELAGRYHCALVAIVFDLPEEVCQQWNRRRGRMDGQVRIRVRYRELATPWFDYLMVGEDELRALLDGTGWRLTRTLGSPELYVAIVDKE